MHLRIIQEELLALTPKQFHIVEVRSFFAFFKSLYTIVTQRLFFVSISSSSAAERVFKRELLKIFIIVLLICFSIFFVNHRDNNKYIIETLELNGSVEKGDALFRMNCVGCHGITARGLVGPDLHSITKRLNDKEIIKQFTGCLTPPMPSFEIDPVNMSNLLKYIHSLE